MTPAGPRLVEWNVDPCLGGLASSAVFDCFRRAGRAGGLASLDPMRAIEVSLLALRGRVGSILVVMRDQDLPRWRGNAERWCAAAEAAGLDAQLVSPNVAAARVAQASARAPIGLIRAFHLDHVASIEADVARLIAAALLGRAAWVYGFDTELYGDKQWLARVALPMELASYVPITCAARDVERALRVAPASWVLKPHAGSAGADVIAGCEATPSDFARAIDRAIREPGWIAQRFVMPSPGHASYVDVERDTTTTLREIETLGVFLVDGKYAGVWSRSKPVSEGAIIDASARFNVVATRARSSERAPRAVAVAASSALPQALRQLWAPAEEAEISARIRSFEGLAVAHLTRRSKQHAARPEAIGAAFARPSIPDEGASIDALQAELSAALLPHCHDKRAPTYFAHLDVPPADLSVAAGTLIRALAQDPVTWTSSKSGTFLEAEVTRWFADLVYPDQQRAAGVACSGGTQANLLAVLLARNLAFARLGGDLDVERLGLFEATRRAGVTGVRILASRAAHGSLLAAVRHAGLGDQSLVWIETDQDERIRVEALEAALDDAHRDGHLVALVVLSAGTVGTGAVDPLPAAIEACHARGVRVHVDAAHGAMLLFSERARARLEGLALADSVTADPHKILGLNQGLGMLLLREGDDRTACAKARAPYFVSPDGAPETARFALDGTRPLNALGAWILLRHVGRAGYERIVDHLLALTTHLARGLASRSELSLHAAPAMNLVLFRPASGRDEDTEALYQDIEQGPFAVSRYRAARGLYLRAVLVNPATQTSDIDAFLRFLDAHA
jgi:L-2,4-diaminobutyrate decarboxylase